MNGWVFLLISDYVLDNDVGYPEQLSEPAYKELADHIQPHFTEFVFVPPVHLKI